MCLEHSRAKKTLDIIYFTLHYKRVKMLMGNCHNDSKKVWLNESFNFNLFLQECTTDRYRHEQCEEHNTDTTKYRAHFMGGISEIYLP